MGNASTCIEEIGRAAKPQLNHEGHEGVEASRLDFSLNFRGLLRLRRLKNFVSFVPFVVQKFTAAWLGAFPTPLGLSAPMGRRGDFGAGAVDARYQSRTSTDTAVRLSGDLAANAAVTSSSGDGISSSISRIRASFSSESALLMPSLHRMKRSPG